MKQRTISIGFDRTFDDNGFERPEENAQRHGHD